MKLNLECGDNLIIGYENYDSNATAEMISRGVKRVHFSKLPLPNKSSDYIQAVDVISCVGLTQIDEILQHWKSKLADGGKIYIEDNDAEIIGHAMAYHSFDLYQYNSIVYGQQDKPRITMFNLVDFIDIAIRNGFEVSDRGYTGHKFYVTLIK